MDTWRGGRRRLAGFRPRPDRTRAARRRCGDRPQSRAVARRAAANPEAGSGDQKTRLQTAKDAARWLASFGARRLPVVAGVVVAVEAAQWLRSELPSIRSYQDKPKTYDELVRGAQEARAGYHRHHVVEQQSASDGIPRSMIDGPGNVVSVPAYRHRKISSWYQTNNLDFGGLSPRNYLRGKDWSERVRVGRDALKRFGVLKP